MFKGQRMKDENAKKRIVSSPKRRSSTRKRLNCSINNKSLREKKRNAKKKSFAMN